MDELIRFVEMNQEPLVEIMSAMELPPEITEREVSYLKKWREELKVEWPLIKEAFLRGKISGKWEKYGFVYVDLTMYQWYGDAIYSLDDLRLFEERERERLKKKPLDRRATPHKDNNQKTFRVRKNAAVEGDCRIFDFYRSSFVQIWVDHSISTPHPAPA